MTTIRPHAERDQRALALVIALAAVVAAVLAAVMMMGSDDPTAPLPAGPSAELNLGADHAGLILDNQGAAAADQ